MRSHLQQKVQPARRGTEPGPQASLGEFPSARQTDPSLSHGSDPAPPDKNGFPGPCVSGVGTDPQQCGCSETGRLSPRCGIIAGTLIFLIKVYQKTISPLFPGCCRFYPTCSHYALEALRIHGVIRGLTLSVWRILRCAPWCPGGYDPVPPLKSGKKTE